MKLIHENTEYEILYKQPTPRVRAAFASALRTMPKPKSKSLQEKMLRFAAQYAEEGEELINVQIRAIKAGEIDVQDILSVSEPDTVEETSLKDHAYIRMFCAIAETAELPPALAEEIGKGVYSDYLLDNLNMKEVKAFIDSFRRDTDD